MKTTDKVFKKDFSKEIIVFKPLMIYLLFAFILLFSSTSEVYSQSNNQLTNSENLEKNGDDCSEFICGDYDDKLLICHVPPGEPENEHEICISSNAIQTHLTHGDYCGPCTLLSNPTPENLPNISIYPNPFTNVLYIELNQDLLANNKNFEVIIFDLLGRIIKRVTPIYTAKFELDFSDLNDGIFIYNIINNKEVIGKGKIVKN